MLSDYIKQNPDQGLFGEKHMPKRMIDADELIKIIKDLNLKQGWNRKDIHYSLADIIYIIDLMPKGADHKERCWRKYE